jgi:hypothetical protein
MPQTDVPHHDVGVDERTLDPLLEFVTDADVLPVTPHRVAIKRHLR